MYLLGTFQRSQKHETSDYEDPKGPIYIYIEESMPRLLGRMNVERDRLLHQACKN